MSRFQIIARAVGALNERAGYTLAESSLSNSDRRGYAESVRLVPLDPARSFAVPVRGVKATVDRASAAAMTLGVERAEEPSLVVATHVTPSARALLSARNVGYVDAAGNARLIVPERGVAIVLDGAEKPVAKARPRLGLAGVKVGFVLLAAPEWVARTYREIAEAAGVSRGSVGNVMSDCTSRGYLVRRGKGRGTTFRIRNRRGLLDAWTNEYADSVRASLIVSRLRPGPDTPAAEGLDLDRLEAWWGGEVAAEALSCMRSPEAWTLYTSSPQGATAKALRATPDSDGTIEIVRPFWNQAWVDEHVATDRTTVPDVVVYGDLVATGNARLAEVAECVLGSIR